ncbi:MAG: serine protease [Pseudohongiellaceae bacterium]|jgi:serine protease
MSHSPLCCLVVGAALFAAAPLSAQLTSTGSGGQAEALATIRAKPMATMVTGEHQPNLIEVKFEHGSQVRLQGGLFERGGELLHSVNVTLAVRGAQPRRMFTQSDTWLDGWRKTGEERSGLALHELKTFYFIDVPPGQPVGLLCDELNAHDIVTLAWPAPSGGDPLWSPTALLPAPEQLGGTEGGTPNLQGNQGYRAPAPEGIGAEFGNAFSGGRGIGVTIADCETGWTDDHEDLAANIAGQFVGFQSPPYPWDHGTAVMGEILSGANGFGTRGIAWEAAGLMSTHSPSGGPQNIPGSVVNGAEAVGPGDVVVIEIQCSGSVPGPYPCEFDPPMFTAVQTATANGTHVIAAAGNGGNNLDQAAYGGAFDLNQVDSGAVMVGASNGVSLVAASFSNYGSRLTSSGWGFNVASTGYGDLYDGGPETLEYTNTFNGTSSATPIVTGAAIDLIAIHREAFGTHISPLDLRDLLETTGTAWQGTKQIGNRPDMRAAVRELGVPEIALGGNLVPGGTLSITHQGEAGDAYALVWAFGLASTPLHLAPYGYLYLDPLSASFLPVNGIVGGSGQTTDNYFIPNNPNLSGISTYFQSVQVFNNKPGTGSLSNFARWVFP